MNAPPTDAEIPPPEPAGALVADSEARQRAYAAARRLWAERVGRPYTDDSDARPPPGELDALAEE